MINKHGFKMVGLKKVSGETKSLHGFYSPEYLELFYDRTNGEIFTRYQYSPGHQWWTQFDDDNIIACGHIYSPKTMQEIADKAASYAVIEIDTVEE